MRDTKAQRFTRYFDNMARLGIRYDDAAKLRRIEMTLQKWAEQECGDSESYDFGSVSWAIERDEATGKPYRVREVTDRRGTTKTYRDRIADREAGALRRLARIMAAYPDLTYYHQTDPRGCALYILRKADIPRDYFAVIKTDGGWTIQRKGSDSPYSVTIKTKAEAKAFAFRQTVDCFYTRGLAACV